MNLKVILKYVWNLVTDVAGRGGYFCAIWNWMWLSKGGRIKYSLILDQPYRLIKQNYHKRHVYKKKEEHQQKSTWNFPLND